MVIHGQAVVMVTGILNTTGSLLIANYGVAAMALPGRLAPAQWMIHFFIAVVFKVI